jgi:hypothetical protein
MIHRLVIWMKEKCILLSYEMELRVQCTFIAVSKGLERKVYSFFVFTVYFLLRDDEGSCIG